jgi:uncharacterized protein
MFPRFTLEQLTQSLATMRVVALVGPRQAGKSTLAMSLTPNEAFGYRTLDNPSTLELARQDPTTFLAHNHQTLIIDEIQRAPELILPIKMIVDQDMRPGRFLLTGSADVFAMRQTQDSLAGRIANIDLFPLSQSEITGIPPTFIADVFNGHIPPPAKMTRSIEAIVGAGGFPSVQTQLTKRAKRDWMDNYIQTMVARDVRTISNIHDLNSIDVLVQQLALRASGEYNVTTLAKTLGVTSKTIDAHIGVLERLFLVKRIPPFYGNELKRLIKAPKLFFLDSGLLSHIRRFDPDNPPEDRMVFGALLENFVLGELMKQSGWAEDKPRIYHLRSSEGLEVDFILESWDRKIVAIEVKAGATIHYDWVKPIKAVSQALGSDFVQGIILYTGNETLVLGDKITAVPISSLWGASR